MVSNYKTTIKRQSGYRGTVKQVEKKSILALSFNLILNLVVHELQLREAPPKCEQKEQAGEGVGC